VRKSDVLLTTTYVFDLLKCFGSDNISSDSSPKALSGHFRMIYTVGRLSNGQRTTMVQESHSDEVTPPSLEDIDPALRRRDEFGEMLASHGYRDVLVLSRDAGADALGGKRPALLDYLKEYEPSSVREVARELDRDKSDVSRDLTRLSELGIVKYVDGPRGAKAPRLKHEHVVIEPIV